MTIYIILTSEMNFNYLHYIHYIAFDYLNKNGGSLRINIA